MGNTLSTNIEYSIEVEPSKNENQTGVRRNALHPQPYSELVKEYNINNCWEIFQRGKNASSSRGCLGYRPLKSDNSFGKYEWLTYDDVEKLAIALGSALLDIIPCKEFPNESIEAAQNLRLLGIFSKNCVPWFVTEQAANAFNFTLIPFYSSLKIEATEYIFTKTQLTAIAGSESALELFLNSKIIADQLDHFISFDDKLSDKILEQAQQSNVKVLYYKELINTPPKPIQPGNLDSISTICYTSGTTAVPKGVILTHGNIVANVIACIIGPCNSNNKFFDVSSDDIHLSYLPTAHVFERAISNLVYCYGGGVGIYSGDISKLMDDIKELKPTIFISVPRLINRIHDKVFANIRNKSYVAQRLFDMGVAAKLKQFRATGALTHKVYDSLVFNKVKAFMGGELRYMIVGGAPISSAVQERVEILFSTPISQGYGLTETMGTSFIQYPNDNFVGHIGGPLPGIEFKLQSVPSLNYTVKDELPRGEVLMRGPTISKGYFNDPEISKTCFDEDNWFLTGDIAVLLPNGSFKIIDRKKNIFKLSQGEYVSPETVESVYSHSRYVSQIYAYGNSEKNTLVAIVVVEPDEAEKWKKENKLENMKFEDLCMHEPFIKNVLDDMQQVANKILNGFERVKAIHLTPNAFTEDNSLITPTQKLKRHTLYQYFKKEIDHLYDSLDT